jgi:hypothetical protein
MTKGQVQVAIAEAQANVGDIAGAEQTVKLIRDWNANVGLARAAIAEARAKATGTNIQPVAPPKTQSHDSIRWWVKEKQETIAVKQPIEVSDWLHKLDDFNLNRKPFLDLAAYLADIHSDNPQEHFRALEQTADEIISAQNAIDTMLNQSLRK